MIAFQMLLIALGREPRTLKDSPQKGEQTSARLEGDPARSGGDNDGNNGAHYARACCYC